MRIIFTLFLAFALSLTAAAQQNSNYWTEVAEHQMVLPQTENAAPAAQTYRMFELDLQALRQALRHAPMEFTAEGRTAPLTVTLPMPDGTFRTMAVVESPVMHPDVAAKFPQIKSFKAYDINAPQFNGRFDYSPLGFNAIFESPAGEVFIAPYDGQTTYHTVYHTKDIDYSDDPLLSCGLEISDDTLDPMEGALTEDQSHTSSFTGGRSGEPLDLIVYDFALTCTGEFAQALGNGTLENVLARFNTATNIVNQIYENETAIRFQLIAEIENIIFLDPLTDPFASGENTNLIFGDVEGAIVTAGGISFEAYDIGHVFTMSCFSPGNEFGIAGIAVANSICQDTKTLGITCFPSNPGFFQGRVRGTMTHEVGHQFSALHTFSNCPGANTALSPGSAFEPGAGSTIMSYSNSCGNQNVIVISDNYFHVKSLEDILYFSREIGGSTCPTYVPTNNTIPTVELPYEDGFYIPISTPFELAADVVDMEDDPLTYCWEQFNLGPVADLGNPFGDAPIFQSFPPTPSPSRVFPRYEMLLNNQQDQYEVLPTYARNLKFRCTVRDNNPEAGAAVWEEVSFQATNTAGPFLVEGPNTGSEEWQVGDFVEVTWDVASTTNSLVNCQFVNIKLSVDGGFTYPFTLVSDTPNDGSEFVSVPDTTVNNRARVRVEAANNIFFDISNQNFDLIPADEPGFALTASPSFQQVCLPEESVVVDLSTFGILDFNNAIQFEIIDGLPVGAVASITANNVLPSESSTIEIDMTEVTEEGLYEVTLRAIAADADTTFRTLFFDVYSNDFSELSLNTPPDGTDGIILSTDFDWVPSNNAITYDFQVANDASFAPGTIIDSGSGLTDPDFGLSVLLEENDIFYWRVRPVNECGPGPWQEAHTFHTTAVDCIEYQATDVPTPISGSGLPQIESTIFVAENGTIQDINIPLISGSYQPVNSLRLTLISPAGTEVVLFNRNCGNTVNFDIGFDDDAPQDIQCPPDDNIVFKPEEALSAFIGENTFGEWTLRIKVVVGGFGGGGGLDSWGVEFCAALTNDNPSLITNDTLYVPPGEANVITPAELEVQDGNFSASQIEYNIITPPAHGTLFRNADPLGSAGEDFFQTTINALNLIYQHDGSDTEFDSFTFLVENPEGGWIIPQTFNIRILDDAVVDVEEVPMDETDVLVYPNPASSQLFIAFEQRMNQEVDLQIYNVQGQLLQQTNQVVVGNQLQVNISNLPAGMYLLNLRTEEGVITKRISVQR